MITLLTPRFLPIFMNLWTIANVSISFMPLEVIPHLHRYGYAIPFDNVPCAVCPESLRWDEVLPGTRNVEGGYEYLHYNIKQQGNPMANGLNLTPCSLLQARLPSLQDIQQIKGECDEIRALPTLRITQ
ncbi:hypothetical protein CPB85DRAFT_1431477 [Mucidula mucida]|nr:hypothetical protein CPB85DRAFT_1431477 [Mucidula mucida]